jgi:hypothetical protein
MTEQQFKREVHYGAAMALTAEMAARGLVLPEECAILDARFAQYYKPVIGRISPRRNRESA